MRSPKPHFKARGRPKYLKVDFIVLLLGQVIYIWLGYRILSKGPEFEDVQAISFLSFVFDLNTHRGQPPWADG